METTVNTAASGAELEKQKLIDKIQSDHCFIGHPFGIGVMSFKFMTNSLASYGMSAILIYYLYAAVPGGVGLTKTEASQLITLDAALATLFSIIGSYMADRVFGNRKAYRMAAILAPLSYVALAIPGLGIIGYLLNVSLLHINSMIAGSSMYSLMGKLYAQGDKRRDGAFAITYVLSNVGAMVPTVTGTIALMAGYHAAFAFCAVSSILGSAVYLATEKRSFGPIGLEPDDPLPMKDRKKAVVALVLFVIALIAILTPLFLTGTVTITSFSNIISTASLFVPIVYFLFILRSPKVTQKERSRLLYIIPMFIASSLAMMVWYQATTILAIYAETSVNLVFFGKQVTPAIYMTIQAIMAIVFGSFITGLWSKLGEKQPSTPWKMGFGTMLYGLGTLIMILPFQLYAPGVKVSPFWLVAFYAVVIAGEGISYPAGNSAASMLAPVAFSTQMMTVWGMAMSTGANLSTLVSNFYKEGSETPYFLFIGGITAFAGLVVLIFSKKLAAGMGIDAGHRSED